LKGASARQKAESPLLLKLGERVRSLRQKRGWSLKVLADRCGLSERFVSDLEGGRANISVLNLAGVAQALEVRAAELIAEEAPPPEQREVVALLGLRGAGKSSVGQLLGERLRVPFFELDRLVEAEAGMQLSEVFAIHGEAYYRQMELVVLGRLLGQHKRAVLATGGGVVTSPEAFMLLRQQARTVWLKAAPEDHWQRVVSQGDLRPMRNRPHAMAELKRRLKEREPLYAQAELTCNTTNRSVEQVAEEILRQVGSR